MNTNQKYPSFVLGRGKDGADISYTLGPRESVILMAGTCGNGRTTLIQRIITQLISSYFSDEVQLILADTIGISFGQYKGLSYLIKDPLIKPKEATTISPPATNSPPAQPLPAARRRDTPPVQPSATSCWTSDRKSVV